MDLRQRLDLLTAKRPAQTPQPGTAERLERLLQSSPRREGTKHAGDAEVAARLGGEVLDAGVVLVEAWLPLAHVHGNVALGSLLDAPLEVLAGGLTNSRPRPEELLFLDTETTGLAGGSGTLPFLLGLARVEDGGLRLRQYFLTGFRGEQALLEHARAWLQAGRHLVSYNGKTFDVPLLLTRHRLRRLACPLDAKPHLDLLHPTRAAFAALWPDCRLQRAESRLLGLNRPDDLPGSLVPEVWSEFVRSGVIGEVPRILEHNRLDVITLAALLGELCRVHAEPGYRGADAHGLARRHLRAGQQTKALEHLRAGREALDTAGLLELAHLHRRQGEWREALAIWQPLACQGVIAAILALAKFHEHVARDYASAAAACQALVARQPGEQGHRLRLARIRRKLAGNGAG
jgi:uncharacterized protein YprB with RNaseH-like and TPR domain